ncbi:DNA-binding response regulator in two-component regulatory system with EnvZ [Rhodospirillaceae bacterium LM-1]|nr:DNA-binding response regulator in two-component regulatory system with EnvZ [Rhodospirillaceae bacterium LM-1]
MEMDAEILIVDDDREIRDLLARFLTKHGMKVATARDGQELNRHLSLKSPGMIVLDLMLPGEDGLSICRRLRADAQTASIPIVMLTAMGEETDRIIGLEMGADDYLPKPFNPRELLARIKAVMRRANATPPAETKRLEFRFAGFRLDTESRSLFDAEGKLVELTGGEFDLLKALAEHAGRVLTRDQLLDLTRGRMAGPYDRSVDIQISRIRKKIEQDAKEPDLIKTVRGGGYVLSCPVQRNGT